MFAKPTRFKSLGCRHVVASTAQAVHCNDNHPVRNLAIVSRRSPRRDAVCTWRQVPTTGRLECFWQVVPVDETAQALEMSWMIRQMQWLPGVCLAL